jgi:phage terminase large subunit-like protein
MTDLSSKAWITELEGYTTDSKHDDAPDSFACAAQRLANVDLGLITNKR